MMRASLAALTLLGSVAALVPRRPIKFQTKLPAKFENPNPLLERAIEVAPQFSEGRRVVFGVFSEEVGAVDSSAAAEAERRALRSAAAENLTNIDAKERKRRAGVAAVGGVATLALMASLVASGAGFGARFGVFPLLALSFGYAQSARAGLWNVAQTGLWDVDGSGLRTIDDADLARRLLEKVNSFNGDTGKQALALSLLFAATAFLPF